MTSIEEIDNFNSYFDFRFAFGAKNNRIKNRKRMRSYKNKKN